MQKYFLKPYIYFKKTATNLLKLFVIVWAASYQINAHAGIGDIIKTIIQGFFGDTERTLHAWTMQVKQTAISTKLEADNRQQSVENMTRAWGVVDQQERIVQMQRDYGIYGQSSHLNCQALAATEKMGLSDYNHRANFFQQARKISDPEPQTQNQSIDESMRNLKTLQELQAQPQTQTQTQLNPNPAAQNKQNTASAKPTFGADRAFFHQNMAKFADYKVQTPETSSCSGVACQNERLRQKQIAAYLNMSKMSWAQP